MNMQKFSYLGLRFGMSLIFLWAFADKLLGLGYATTKANSWINGGSPTYGFLANATKGPFVDFYKGLINVPAVDWLFMGGLLFIGLTLLTNKFVMWGSIAGVIMMALMWSAVLPPVNNPIIDEHIIYIFVFILLAVRSREYN